MNIPLCVDLDGTLIQKDTLWISMGQIIRGNPLAGLGIGYQFLRHGRARMKDWMSARHLPDPAGLPYHPAVVEWARQEHASGRRTLLVTGAHRLIAEPIAQYLDCFDDVIATANDYNMSGLPKAQELVKRFGEGGYDYAGNSFVDIPVWQCARRIIIVNANRRVTEEARQCGEVEREFLRPLEISIGL